MVSWCDLVIKRVEVPEDTEAAGTFPWLMVFVGCQENMFFAHVDFIGEDAAGYRNRLGLLGYGTNGVHGNNREYFINAVREAVEAAITDYLKVNFDL